MTTEGSEPVADLSVIVTAYNIENYIEQCLESVAAWATSRLTPEVADEFDHRLNQHLLRVDLGDLTRIRLRRDPELATRLARRALA